MIRVHENDRNWKYLRSLKPLTVCNWCYYTSNIGGVQIRNLRVAGRPRNKYRGHKLPNYLQRKQVDLPNYYRFGLGIFVLKVRGLEFIVNILRPTVLLNCDLPFV